LYTLARICKSGEPDNATNATNATNVNHANLEIPS
jgi:hypothetical protein